MGEKPYRECIAIVRGNAFLEPDYRLEYLYFHQGEISRRSAEIAGSGLVERVLVFYNSDWITGKDYACADDLLKSGEIAPDQVYDLLKN